MSTEPRQSLGLQLKSPSTKIDNSALAKLFAYQPFVLPDGTVTGVGLAHHNGSSVRSVNPISSPAAEYDIFVEANNRTVHLYDDIIALAKQEVGPLQGLSYLDVACNAGYFCYRMALEGTSNVTGVDAADFSEAFDYANSSLGTSCQFVQSPYDMQTHRIDGITEQFDIVTNISFLCHVSDPTFFIHHLSSLTRRVLVIYSKISRSDEYIVTYSKSTSRYFKQPYPICFDAATVVSDSLLTFALQSCGFRTVREMPIERDRCVLAPDLWRCFIAIR